MTYDEAQVGAIGLLIGFISGVCLVTFGLLGVVLLGGVLVLLVVIVAVS